MIKETKHLAGYFNSISFRYSNRESDIAAHILAGLTHSKDYQCWMKIAL